LVLFLQKKNISYFSEEKEAKRLFIPGGSFTTRRLAFSPRWP
jgi:hypothetical protein